MYMVKNHFIKDLGVMIGRSMRQVFRSMDTIITVTVMPIMNMMLFVYVFGGAIQTGTENYINYLLPGILLISVASGISYTAIRLFTDKQKGMFERFQSMPISRSSILWGHVLTSMLSNVISLIIIVLVALIMGFRSTAGVIEWLTVAGILGVFTMALSWVATIPGLIAKSSDGAGAFAYPIILLPFISSAFVPTETMPFAVRTFAENQPVTLVVDALRDLLSGKSASVDLWRVLALCIGIMLVAYIFAMKIFTKRK